MIDAVIAGCLPAAKVTQEQLAQAKGHTLLKHAHIPGWHAAGVSHAMNANPVVTP
jgi:hypothetical protein